MFQNLYPLALTAALLTLVPGTRSDGAPLPVPPNYCRRFSQRAGIVGNKLFIDGGYVNYGGQVELDDGDPTVNQTNSMFLWVDLETIDGSTLFPTVYTNGTKPGDVPSLAGGAIWADDVNELFYLYGGEYNATDQVPTAYTQWLYDDVYETRNTTFQKPDDIPTPAYGASTVDPWGGTGYYYGGWISNQTMKIAETKHATSDLVSFNFGDQTFNSPASFFDDVPRAEGGLFWLPAGDNGVLIYFGGIQQTEDESGYPIGDWKYEGVNMSTIYIYDIAGHRAYTQQTSGTAPANRRLFCGGASWSDDRSSYNIYIYGGLPPYEVEGIGFDETWILSLPSFTWTPYWIAPDGGFPHHSSSCNVVNGGPNGNGAQMIIMGGAFPNSSFTSCDAPTLSGMHNLYLGDTEGTGDSVTWPWGKYLLNLTDYTLPPNLTNVVGGSAEGAATVRAPANGWNTADLGLIMAITTTSTRTPTRSIPPTNKPTSTSTSSSGGDINPTVIAGSIVGGIAGLTLILTAIWFMLRRRRKQRQDLPPSQQREPAEMGDTQARSELPISRSKTSSAPSSPGTWYSWELPDTQVKQNWELPDNQVGREAVELPGQERFKRRDRDSTMVE